MRLTPIEWICWGAFALVWIAGAIYNVYRGPATQGRSRWFRVWIAIVAVVWLLAGLIPASFWSALRVGWAWPRDLGDILLPAATAFVIYGRVVLGRYWSSTPKIKEGHSLRTTGPYRVTRHPIYTGMLGMTLGTVLIQGFGAGLFLLAIVLAAFEIKIRQEEKLMAQAFGESYAEYRRRVPQLIPGFKGFRGRRTPGAA